MDNGAPWLRFYENVPHSLEYPDCSMAELVFDAADRHPCVKAYDFFGCKAEYKQFAESITHYAESLTARGITAKMRVTLCMPNTPQAVIMFYALNLIGAVANMLHPLSAQKEIERCLISSNSTMIMTLDRFYEKIAPVIPNTPVETVLLTGIEDGLTGAKKVLYKITEGRKIKKPRAGNGVIYLAGFLSKRAPLPALPQNRGGDTAAILYSGGTSGETKGILLTNLNFNALAMQTVAAGDCVKAGNKMLAIMPIFHGFGLGVCIHTICISGGSCILVPQFSIKSYAKLLKKHKPHYIAGVPTLYEALLRIKGVNKIDMSQLEGVFSGGDSLSIELKRKVDAFLKERGASVQIREGYGLTECVTASCLTPKRFHREGSIGIPYPDMFYKITAQNSEVAVPCGEPGEICLTGPTLMKGYDNNPEETANTLRRHADGKLWLHTGDLGCMDSDGFIYFKQRIKRMIISSGYSIYPSQIENVIDAHPDVLISCVIGVPDDYKMQILKAFIVLREGVTPSENVKADIMAHCKQSIAKYALPRYIEFRSSLPKTLIGKVAYTVLEEETRLGLRPETPA